MRLLPNCFRKNLILLALAGALGCVDAVEPTRTLLWDAEFSAASGLNGTAAMVATQGNTQVGIGITGGTGNAQLGWAVRTGLCDTPGQRISGATAFPTITLNANGAGNVQTVVNRRIALSDLYAVEVFSNPNGTGQILACGEFVAAN